MQLERLRATAPLLLVTIYLTIGLHVKLFAISDHIEKLVSVMRYLAVYSVSGVFSAASLLLLLLSFASIAPGEFRLKVRVRD